MIIQYCIDHKNYHAYLSYYVISMIEHCNIKEHRRPPYNACLPTCYYNSIYETQFQRLRVGE